MSAIIKEGSGCGWMFKAVISHVFCLNAPACLGTFAAAKFSLIWEDQQFWKGEVDTTGLTT